MQNKYSVIGMTCSGCQKNVYDSLSFIDGVTAVEVDLELGTAIIESTEKLNLERLQKAFDDSGLHYLIKSYSAEHTAETKSEFTNTKNNNIKGTYYCPMLCEGEKTYDYMGACPVCGMDLVASKLVLEEDTSQYDTLIKQFKVALIFTVPIFILAMSDMLPFLNLGQYIPQQTSNWIQFALSIPVIFYASAWIFKRAWLSIKTWNLNMFTLIALGSGIAFALSLVALLFPAFFPAEFRTADQNVFVYFESVCVILTLVILGQVLEARAHKKTGAAIKELMKLAPTTATLIANNTERTIHITDIKKGFLLRVKPGEKIPVDGLITEGHTTVDESMLSGEMMPVTKTLDSNLFAGTINGNQSVIMKATEVGDKTVLSQIIQMVADASRTRAPMQNIADKLAAYFVPIVFIVAVITFIIWLLFGPTPALVFAFVNSISVLIIACPCALGLATPMSIMVGIGKGAKNGILVKNATALEKFSSINILAIDKTGTITEGKPTVHSIINLSIEKDKNINSILGSISQLSEHPLADACVEFAKNKNAEFKKIHAFNSFPGKGVFGIIEIDNEEKQVLFGNEKFLLENRIKINSIAKESINELQSAGHSVSLISLQDQVIACVSFNDQIKKDSKQSIVELQKLGIEIHMLTGDNQQTAEIVAKAVGIKQYKANCSPEDKINAIKEWQDQGKIVAMTGDGINDAPALAQANIGISMGTGTDVAIESSDITLVSGNLSGIKKAYNLSASVVNNIKQNLFFAFIYNLIGIPIAAGILFPVFGLLLSPMIAALAMSLSSVSVIANALRLKNIKL